ncbi:hypothetical protein BKI52_42355 [marine bacterium AO1-C]|nr:hypothetical protein BKI52_42355 [marine bacterium AO1-C]
MKKSVPTQRALATLILLFLFQWSIGQNADQFAKEADQFITKITSQIPELPSISIVVVKGDQSVFMKSYGYADIARKIKAQNNTPYYIASSTKSFMGMAAAILDNQGKVSLNSTLADGLPYIKFKPEVKAEKITLRNLLSHTSGLKNSFFGFRAAYSGYIDRKEMDWVLANETRRKGEMGKFEYTNLGYNIYTHLTDKKLGLPWQEVLNNLLFKPLQMKRTTAYMSLAKKKGWQCAQPYFASGENGPEALYLMKADNTMQSAGGLITTVEDMANWLAFNMNEGKLHGKQIVPAKVLKTAHMSWAKLDGTGKPYRYTGYSLGWGNALYKGEKMLQHDGSYPGFKAHITMMPEQKIGIAILTNDRSIGGTVAYEISQFVYDWWLSQGKETSNVEVSIEIIKEKIAKIKQRRRAEQKKQALIKWNLTEPLQSYTGTYFSKQMGKVFVKVVDGMLKITHGNLHSLTKPAAAKNTVKVEMVPQRDWKVSFAIVPGKPAHKMNLDGDDFVRVEE